MDRGWEGDRQGMGKGWARDSTGWVGDGLWIGCGWVVDGLEMD